MSRSMHKEFLWSGVSVGHKGWAHIPDNTYPALVSGNLCQSTQRMGHHGAQVSKPLALEADEDTVTVGPRLVTPVPIKQPGARPQAVRPHYLHLCSGTMVTPGTTCTPGDGPGSPTSPACSSDFPGGFPWDSAAWRDKGVAGEK